MMRDFVMRDCSEVVAIHGIVATRPSGLAGIFDMQHQKYLDRNQFCRLQGGSVDGKYPSNGEKPFRVIANVLEDLYDWSVYPNE